MVDDVNKVKEYRYGPREELHRIKVKPGSENVELTVEISNTKKGRDFNFSLKGGRLHIYPGHSHKKDLSVGLDWYKELSEDERVDLMRVVADNYRAPSMARGGMKVAAVGIVENTAKISEKYDKRKSEIYKHLIFVGVNTEQMAQTASGASIYKDCAEQSVINMASTQQAHYQKTRLGITTPMPAKLKELYVMGGAAPNPDVPGDKGQSMVCPCGKCTDALREAMAKNGKIYLMPHDAPLGSSLTIRSADTLGEIGTNEVWRTDINQLNRFHKIAAATSKLKQMQIDGLHEMAEKLASYDPTRRPPPSEKIRQKRDENGQLWRESIPELDVETKRMTAPPHVIDDYMNQKILDLLWGRMTFENIPKDPGTIEEWLRHKVDTVRVAVVQFSDKTYASGAESVVPNVDKSWVSAEFNALQNGIVKLPLHTPQRMWVKEFNPVEIMAGNFMTSPKDPIERVSKRIAPKDLKTFTATYLPVANTRSQQWEKLNHGELGAIAQQFTFHLDDLTPGEFRGRFMAALKSEQLSKVAQEAARALQGTPGEGAHMH